MFLSKMTYQEFLESKIELAQDSGFEVNPADINKALKPHQRDAVIWALKGGRRALFENFGLGKTIQEIEFCKQVIDHEGGRALIVLPLGVKQEFTQDAVNVLGYDTPVYCRSMEEVESCDSSIVLTNYERVRDGDIRPDYFVATSLDEASVLRSFGSKTYQTFLDKFKNVPYKLVATATPSPNKYKELIHYAGYLEIMDTGQALTRFFQRDSTKANNLTLYPNMEDEFWLWVSSWALFITKPSDVNPEYADDPVKKTKEDYTRAQWQIDAHGYWRSSGDRLISKDELKEFSVDDLQRVYREYSRSNVYSYEEHVKLAEELDKNDKLPATFMVVAPGSWNNLDVWDDINRMRTLNTTQSRRRQQMHVCPLHLDIVERIINRYSNEGDMVLDPFGGLMTVPMTAVKMKRYGYGIELSCDYFRDGVGYLQEAENEIETPTLFDFMGN